MCFILDTLDKVGSRALVLAKCCPFWIILVQRKKFFLLTLFSLAFVNLLFCCLRLFIALPQDFCIAKPNNMLKLITQAFSHPKILLLKCKFSDIPSGQIFLGVLICWDMDHGSHFVV